MIVRCDVGVHGIARFNGCGEHGMKAGGLQWIS